MIELTQHISRLLLESDLAIIPGFGGFIAHYRPAMRDTKNNLFIPPVLTVGFNDQLVLNDGLLLQSYMSVNNIGKEEAELLVNQEVEKLRSNLEENGSVILEGIGVLYCNVKNKYSFKAKKNVLDCPMYYGLDAFEMLEVAELMANVTRNEESLSSESEYIRESYTPVSPSSFSYFGAVAVIALAIVSMFMFTSPIENTEVVDVNYAKIVPTELWDQFNSKSITTTPIYAGKEEVSTDKDNPQSKSGISTYTSVTPTTQNVLNEELQTKVTESTSLVSAEENEQLVKPFHLIIASAIQNKQAVKLVNSLQEKGYSEAQVLKNGGHTRVSIACYQSSDEAYTALKTLSQEEEYQSAWVYQVK